jgi:DNA repair ATPase RecN
VEADIAQRKADLAAILDAEQTAAEALSLAEQAEVESARQEHDAMAVHAGLQAELSSAFAAERDAIDGLSRLTHLLEDMEDGASPETTVLDAESAVTMADAEVASARTELAELDKRFDEASAPNGDGPAVTSAAAVEELEWYLLSRLAGQRSLSYAGSLPFVLDEALEGVRGEGLHHLLSRLERMSSAVQVVIVSEDNEIAAWADAIGADRAITLYPVPL